MDCPSPGKVRDLGPAAETVCDHERRLASPLQRWYEGEFGDTLGDVLMAAFHAEVAGKSQQPVSKVSMVIPACSRSWRSASLPNSACW